MQPYRALLEVAESIALHRDLPALFHDLAQRLHRVVRFDFLNLILHDPARQVMRLHILETSEPARLPPGSEFPMGESPAGWVWENQQPLVMAHVDQDTRFPRLLEIVRQHGVRSICLLPLTTAQRRLGALGFGSMQASAYDEAGLEFLQLVAAQVAVAVDNVLNYQSVQQYQEQLARERDRLRVVLDITNALMSNLDFDALFTTVAASVRRVVPHEYVSLALYDAEQNRAHVHALDFPGGGVIHREVEAPPEGLRSTLSVPLATRNRTLGALHVASVRENAFTRGDVALLTQIGHEVAIAIENARAYRQIGELKDKLAKEKLYLEDEIRTEYNFEEIIGESPAWKRVLRDVETVAPTGSTVLIQGESGTGKELVARAIHNLSGRRERTFVKLNCAAIPTGLLESELFGHEEGAFTGAIAPRVGRFELAHEGTLFLDEIGDIPLELQPKLLRVLQEREFERLGGSRTIRVDVRLVTATNRDLGRMVADRRFRDDLYYRVNVFPIVLPPLRERREDIPLLVRYFAQKYAQRMDKQIDTISSEAMEALSKWHWPGNVRELENFIERAVILTRGSVLQVPLSELGGALPPPPGGTTLEAAEREHILRALRETGWVIGGPHGAAARLGMKRTTLQSRMRKLGIRKLE